MDVAGLCGTDANQHVLAGENTGLARELSRPHQRHRVLAVPQRPNDLDLAGFDEEDARAPAARLHEDFTGFNLSQLPMEGELTAVPYGEWPARHAHMGEIELTWAVLAFKGVDGDRAVLIGSCPAGEYPGAHDCSADAGGYHWRFRGSIMQQQAAEPGQTRVWVRSDSPVAAEPLQVSS